MSAVLRWVRGLQVGEGVVADPISPPSVLISAHRQSSMRISAHQCPSVPISAHRQSSMRISAHQCPSVPISAHQRASALTASFCGIPTHPGSQFRSSNSTSAPDPLLASLPPPSFFLVDGCAPSQAAPRARFPQRTVVSDLLQPRTYCSLRLTRTSNLL